MKCGCKIAMTGFSALVSEAGLYDMLHYSTHAFFKVSDVDSTTASFASVLHNSHPRHQEIG